MSPECWDCKHIEYSEYFNSEGETEEDITACAKSHDDLWLKGYDATGCADFEKET